MIGFCFVDNLEIEGTTENEDILEGPIPQRDTAESRWLQRGGFVVSHAPSNRIDLSMTLTDLQN